MTNRWTQLRPPTSEEATKLKNRKIILFIHPAQNKDLVAQLQSWGTMAFTMDCIPRAESRGQTYNTLSSQVNITGYRAVVEASNEFVSEYNINTLSSSSICKCPVRCYRHVIILPETNSCAHAHNTRTHSLHPRLSLHSMHYCAAFVIGSNEKQDSPPDK
jgi:hypothetical protein